MANSTYTFEDYRKTANYLASRLPEDFMRVELGVICGSGLGGLVDTIDPSTKFEFPYHEIPNFASSTGNWLSVCNT